MGLGAPAPSGFTCTRHLHKGLSGAYKASLAAVPAFIAEVRPVRVTGVLDAFRNLAVLVLVLAQATARPKKSGRRELNPHDQLGRPGKPVASCLRLLPGLPVRLSQI